MLEICNECGESVAPGSGRFVNRVPSGDDAETHKEMGKEYPNGGFMCVACDAKEEQTAMPYSDLECLIGFITESERNYYQLGTYPTEEEGEHFKRYKAFLEGVKTLYFVCTGCHKMVAPDQERYQDPASEAWYCMTCLNEGI